MFSSMATRSANNIQIPLHECTQFVLHKTHQNKFDGIQKKIIDFTEHKLLKYINSVSDAQQKLSLAAMIEDYRDGNVAVGWRRGSPCYIKVSKE